MTTFIVLALGTTAIAVVLGGALTVSWLCGMAAGRAAQWALGGHGPEPADDVLSAEHMAQTDALVAESQRLLRDSQRREAFSRT